MGENNTLKREYVSLDRVTVATAIDLLSDLEQEADRVDATGPYRNEISETIDGLATALGK